jgi:hypothetical protein
LHGLNGQLVLDRVVVKNPENNLVLIAGSFWEIACRPTPCRKNTAHASAAIQVQTLYVCLVDNVLGRIPLIQCYLNCIVTQDHQ